MNGKHLALTIVALLLLSCALLVTPTAAAVGPHSLARGSSLYPAESGGGSETGHILGYVTLSLIVLVIVLGIFLANYHGDLRTKHILRGIHFAIGALALLFAILHLLTVGG